MNHARTRRRLTGWLALLALALQFAAAFGHVHRKDVAKFPQTGLVAVAAPSDAPAGPADPDHLTCDICATLHLLGASALPAPPALALPVASTLVAASAAALAPAPPLTAAFDARGPPQA